MPPQCTWMNLPSSVSAPVSSSGVHGYPGHTIITWMYCTAGHSGR